MKKLNRISRLLTAFIIVMLLNIILLLLPIIFESKKPLKDIIIHLIQKPPLPKFHPPSLSHLPLLQSFRQKAMIILILTKVQTILTWMGRIPKNN